MKAPADEPKAGAPDWMVTFADLMSLLLTFFVLLLSFSTVEKQKFLAVVGSVRSAFGMRSPADMLNIPTGREILPQQTPSRRADERSVDTRPILVQLRDAVEQAGLHEGAIIKASEDGVILLLDGDLAFPPGQTEISERARGLLDQMANIALASPGQLEVRGHTDDRPLSAGRFPSNWELSAARAASAVRYLADRGVPQQRLKAVGLGDSRPVVPNDTDENRSRNRRVEFAFITAPAKISNPATGAFRSRGVGAPIRPE